MGLCVPSATRWPALPVNVATAFWPGTVAVSVTGAPPAVIVAAASGGTLNSCSVIEPPVWLSGCTLIT